MFFAKKISEKTKQAASELIAPELMPILVRAYIDAGNIDELYYFLDSKNEGLISGLSITSSELSPKFDHINASIVELTRILDKTKTQCISAYSEDYILQDINYETLIIDEKFSALIHLWLDKVQEHFNEIKNRSYYRSEKHLLTIACFAHIAAASGDVELLKKCQEFFPESINAFLCFDIGDSEVLMTPAAQALRNSQEKILDIYSADQIIGSLTNKKDEILNPLMGIDARNLTPIQISSFFTAVKNLEDIPSCILESCTSIIYSTQVDYDNYKFEYIASLVDLEKYDLKDFCLNVALDSYSTIFFKDPEVIKYLIEFESKSLREDLFVNDKKAPDKDKKEKIFRKRDLFALSIFEYLGDIQSITLWIGISQYHLMLKVAQNHMLECANFLISKGISTDSGKETLHWTGLCEDEQVAAKLKSMENFGEAQNILDEMFPKS